MKGWHYESTRHAMAAKGMRSYRAKAGFIDPIESRRFKIPATMREESTAQPVVVQEEMNKDDIDRVLQSLDKGDAQIKAKAAQPVKSNWDRPSLGRYLVDGVREVIELGKEKPIPRWRIEQHSVRGADMDMDYVEMKTAEDQAREARFDEYMKGLPAAERAELEQKMKSVGKKKFMAEKAHAWWKTDKNESATDYVHRELTGHEKHGMEKFKKGVTKTAQHPFKDLDGEWKEYTSLVENDRYGKYGHADRLAPDGTIQRWNQRGAALFARVATQANVEPLVDGNGDRSFRELMLDLEFGRRM